MDVAGEIVHNLKGPTSELRELIPDVWDGFAHLRTAALADGALPRTTKELIALALAIVDRCDGCMAHHATVLARLDVTAEQVAEAIGVTVLMAGGPATVYGPRAWQMYRERAAATASDRLEGHRAVPAETV